MCGYQQINWLPVVTKVLFEVTALWKIEVSQGNLMESDPHSYNYEGFWNRDWVNWRH